MSKRTDREYLYDIREAIRRIKAYTGDRTWSSFLEDTRTQDAVIRNLEVMGEATKNLSTGIRQQTSSRFVLIFGLLFAFQPNSEVMQPATCFHDHVPKFGATETDNVVNDPIPLDIADNMFNTNANG